MSAPKGEIRVTTNYALTRTLERILTTLDEQKRIVLSGVGRHMGTTFVFAHAVQQRVPGAAYFCDIDLYTFTPRDATEEVTAPRLRITVTTEPTAEEQATSAFHPALPKESIIPRETQIPMPPRRRREGAGGDKGQDEGSDGSGAADADGSKKRRRRRPRGPGGATGGAAAKAKDDAEVAK